MATEEQMAEWFEKHDESQEFLKFDRIPDSEKPFPNPDLCAFARISQRMPLGFCADIVCSAGHEQIHLERPSDQMGGWNLTEDDVIYLLRCGVFLDSEFGDLSMFV